MSGDDAVSQKENPVKLLQEELDRVDGLTIKLMCQF
jgi:hypothetical protein